MTDVDDPDDPRSAEVVEAPEAAPEPTKRSVTGTVVGSEHGDGDDEQSDPGGDIDAMEQT
jgi:hypothetical protein